MRGAVAPLILLMTLVDSLTPLLKPGMRVLDVGTGNFEDALTMRDLGCDVTALDVAPKATIPTGITFIHEDFRSFTPQVPYDVVYLSFIVNFLDKQTFFNEILPRYSDARIVAIRTFSARPEPSDPDKPITLYALTDFQGLPWDPVVAKTWDETYPGYDGVSRSWHLLEYVGVKP